MARSSAISQGCYEYVGLIVYETPTAGAKYSVTINAGRTYKACYEATEIGDYVYLTNVYDPMTWLGIRRDGFVGEKGGWWLFLGKEGPKDYRATRLFQGHWGRSRWTAARLMAPLESRIVYRGAQGTEVLLAVERGAPAAGVPFERTAECRHDIRLTDTASCDGFSFRILSASESSITFVVVRSPLFDPKPGSSGLR